MALCEVGLGHLRPESISDPYAPGHDGWTLNLSDEARTWDVVEQVWRARELTYPSHLCFEHFNSTRRHAATCTASRPMIRDCRETP